MACHAEYKKNALPQPVPNSCLFVVEAEDALEDEDVGAVHRHRLLLAAVRHEVVDRNVNLLAILQSLQKLKI